MRIHPNVPAPRSAGAFTLWNFLFFTLITLLSFWIATQWVAQALAYQPRLGAYWFSIGHWRIYRPWEYWRWQWWYSAYAPEEFRGAFVICAVGPMFGIVAMLAFAVWRSRKARVASTHGSARWGLRGEYREASLLDGAGVVLGVLPDGQFLTDNGPRHVACIAPTRSGKGVGQVIPTLLTWPGSVLVHDMKGENWQHTAGYRAGFSNVIYFNPTDPARSAHFNPLMEVRVDENQIRDVQNIADQIVDPHGKGKESHWDRAADQFFLAVILHVLHAEADKSLYGISRFLSDPTRTFAATLQRMKNTPHKDAMAHERIAAGAQAMLNKAEEERSGVLSSALAFLGLYADPIVARNTADSDFRITDLMRGNHPLSLYIVVPDSDRLRLKPLTRLMITLITQRLVEVLNPEENKHRLLMLLDEFPRLGRMQFLSDALSYLAGYHIKVMLIMQSLGQLDAPESYGKGNTIVESCHSRCFYTPQDPHTAQWIADSLGSKTEVHQQTMYTGHRLAPWLGHVMVSDQESARPLMDAAEVCKLPANDSILFVAGFPPFKAKRLKYYEHPVLSERAAMAPPKLRGERPYPYRPRPHPNPWANRIIKDPAHVTDATKQAAMPPKNASAQSDSGGLSLGMSTKTVREVPDGERLELANEAESERHQEPDTASEDDAALRRQGLDEQENLRRQHRDRPRPSIPL
jgi:type IV secretion system protein VirD4